MIADSWSTIIAFWPTQNTVATTLPADFDFFGAGELACFHNYTLSFCPWIKVSSDAPTFHHVSLFSQNVSGLAYKRSRKSVLTSTGMFFCSEVIIRSTQGSDIYFMFNSTDTVQLSCGNSASVAFRHVRPFGSSSTGGSPYSVASLRKI